MHKNGTPRQGCLVKESKGVIRILDALFNNPHHSLQGLEEYSHVWSVFFNEFSLVKVWIFYLTFFFSFHIFFVGCLRGSCRVWKSTRTSGELLVRIFYFLWIFSLEKNEIFLLTFLFSFHTFFFGCLRGHSNEDVSYKISLKSDDNWSFKLYFFIQFA